MNEEQTQKRIEQIENMIHDLNHERFSLLTGYNLPPIERARMQPPPLFSNGGKVHPPQDKTKLEQAVQYARAEFANAVGGAADEQTQAERLKVCNGCEFRAVEYNGKKDEQGIGWCSRCGCGNNDRAKLVEKVKLSKATCPLEVPKWGASDGVGGSISSVVDTVKGVANTIASVIKKDN